MRVSHLSTSPRLQLDQRAVTLGPKGLVSQFLMRYGLWMWLWNMHLHYWKRVLCRGPEDLPRAKSQALGKDTLCRGPATGALGKEAFAEGMALGKDRPTANQIFAEGLV